MALHLTERALGACSPTPEGPDRCLDLLLFAAGVAVDAGRAQTGEGYARRALRLARATTGEESVYAAAAYDMVGVGLVVQGRIQEALLFYRRALAIRLRLLGEDHADTAQSYYNLGLATGGGPSQDFTEAESLLRRSLAIRQRILGEDDEDTASSYVALAEVLTTRRNLTEAEALFRRALSIHQRVLGGDHPQILNDYDRIGGVLLDSDYFMTEETRRSRAAEAEAWFRRALEVRRAILGDEHVGVARSYLILGSALDAQGRFSEAETWLRRSLAIRQRAHGEDHADTAQNYQELGDNLLRQQRREEAETMMRRALVIRRRILGDDHPAVEASSIGVTGTLLRDDNALARWLAEKGRFERAPWPDGMGEIGFFGDWPAALTRIDTALAACAPTAERPDRCLELILAAADYSTRAGRAEQGEAHARRALALAQATLSEQHPALAAAHNLIAASLLERGRAAEAEGYFRQGLALAVRTTLTDYLPGAYSSGESYSVLGLCLEAQRRVREAEQYHRAALAMEGNRSELLRRLGENLRDQGRLPEAAVLFRQALAGLDLSLGDHPDSAAVFDGLGRTLEAGGSLAEAEAYYRLAVGGGHNPLANGHLDRIAQRLHLADLWQRLGSRPREGYALREGTLSAVLGRLAASPTHDSSVQSELAGYRADFVRHVAAAWIAAQGTVR